MNFLEIVLGSANLKRLREATDLSYDVTDALRKAQAVVNVHIQPFMDRLQSETFINTAATKFAFPQVDLEDLRRKCEDLNNYSRHIVADALPRIEPPPKKPRKIGFHSTD